MRRRLAAFVVASSLAVPAVARATPQVGMQATTGAALTDLREGHGPRLAAHLGFRGDALFLRDRPGQVALGPYIEGLTAAFDTFEAGGGASFLVPAGSPALIFSAGAFARGSATGWEPGAAARIFWGARSFNYHAPYGLALGLFVQGRLGIGASRQADAVAGVEVDLAYLALPFVLAYEAARR